MKQADFNGLRINFLRNLETQNIDGKKKKREKRKNYLKLKVK